MGVRHQRHQPGRVRPDRVERRSRPGPVAGTRTSQDVVIFGGGSSLWALDGEDRQAARLHRPRPPQACAAQEAAGRPRTRRPSRSSPPQRSRTSSSRPPAAADLHRSRRPQRRRRGRTGVVALRLLSQPEGRWSFKPLWKNDAETNRTYYGRQGLTAGSGQGQGCGDVWSSPAVDTTSGVMIYGVGNCDRPTHGEGTPPELVRVVDGRRRSDRQVPLALCTGRAPRIVERRASTRPTSTTTSAPR